MNGFIKISEAASIALHSMVFMAARHDTVSVNDISSCLHVSEAHLSKVLQRLAKNGLIRSVRGPRGGYALAKPEEMIFLKDIYEAIEGAMKTPSCLMGQESCSSEKCIMGDALVKTNKIVSDHLGRTRLSDLTDVYHENIEEEIQ